MSALGQLKINVNQVGFDRNAYKMAVVEADSPLADAQFEVEDSVTHQVVFKGVLSSPLKVEDWSPGKLYYRAEFSPLQKDGQYQIVLPKEPDASSPPFQIGEHELAKLTLGSIIGYYHKQRANTPQEIEADSHVQLHGSDKRVDMHGGWCDASGDVSKYFSHLAYSNFMLPQQTPMVVWSMLSVHDSIPKLLSEWKLKESLEEEAIWGADYMMRALSEDDYFYMIIFSYFDKNPSARRVVGLHANSVTTDEYQAAFREGGGMAIAALARISHWHRNGDYTSEQYLAAAERAFAHLLVHNTEYDDDGKENILDDYCALTAATELWIATDKPLYRDEARKRAANLEKRMTGAGYFLSDDGIRPFFHAADAGLPVVALCRYLDKEHDEGRRKPALETIQHALDYELRVTNEVSNPYGYARQSFLFEKEVRDGFFIPHENETGWWWQGENARLGSLATAAILGGRLVQPGHGAYGVSEPLGEFASRQTSWILGCNPYSMCFMYKFGQNNVPHMHSQFGHGSEAGGISNGVTGKEGNPDGSGIDFKLEDNGNEWRWTEQWLPHAAWFMQALAAECSTR